MDRDYLAIARQYEADVIAGTIPACRWVKLACERNQRDYARRRTPEFLYDVDEEQATKICRMAEMLPHIKGPKAVRTGAFYEAEDGKSYAIWNPIVLEPWQCWLFTTLFGWVSVLNRSRRFRVAFILVPRKNSKSTMGAILVLYMLTSDGESGADCVSAATTRDQAKVVAEIAWEMSRRSKAFCEYFGVKVGAKTQMVLSVPSTGSKFGPLSADANSLDGLNISLAVVDEVHAHKTRAVWDVLDTATGARLQPILAGITTAGVSLGGICHEQMAYLERVLDGSLVDETRFGINYTIDDGDRWQDETSWRKANPNYGVSVQPDDLARKAAAAAASPAAINNFLTKHLNVWVRSESGWLLPEAWRACGKPEWASLSPADRYAAAVDAWKGYPCWIGVDLAEVRDVAAAVALFRLDDDHYGMIPRLYLPEAAIARSPIAQMSGWVHDGAIIETEGDQADYQRIEDDIVAWCDVLNVQSIDFDRALAAQMQQGLKRRLEPRMGRDAVDAFVLTVPQTVETMNPAMQLVERLVLSKRLQHDGNPAMTWMIGNIVVERNYKDEIYPRKAGGKDSPNKIDGPVALFTCLSQAMGPMPGPVEDPVLVTA